jgi:aryl-alcohol dehydrogenase-like predicted oxidoreductase
MDIADGLVPIAKAHNATVAQIALAWVAAQPGVTAPIAGPRTLEQLIDNLGAISIELTPEDFDTIDELAPPGTNAADFYEASFKPNDHRF